MTSPTYTIGHRYDGRVDVSHLDLYRFAASRAAEWGDLEPYFDDAIVFVEWPEAGAGALPPAARRGAARARRAVDAQSRSTISSDADPRLRHRDRRRDQRARRRRRGARRAHARALGTLLEDVDALLAAGAARGRRDARRARRRHRAGQLHGRAHRPRRPPAGSRSRSASPPPASRRSHALAAGAPGALPVIDARRREVFVPRRAARARARRARRWSAARVCVGDGAVRYRAVLEGAGAEVPPDDDERHLPRARFHAAARARLRPGRGGRAAVPPRPRRDRPRP